ncbi:MAG: beta-galactosidase [Alkalibacterium sp.]|nr:beta-galactosidase [Alkalibacterium sp.]
MFEIKDEFYWKGKPVKIISGSIHYFRVVPEYWKDRLIKLKAMGCNTVETYVPWNSHEPKEGAFTFEGQADLAGFIRTAEALDLFVILRPSPYICAEWEFGGLPGWLLKDKNMRLRTNYGPFIEKVATYFERLFKEVVDLQCTHGGPIIMMQVENEYGSYGNDKAYLKELVRLMKGNGVDVPLVTSDGTWLDMLENGTIIEDALPTVNFGSNPKDHFQILQDFVQKPMPLMVMEFWNGWFTAWGDSEFKKTIATEQAGYVEDILKMGHINFYMFHGGTQFGFYNGSNYYDELTPDVTSYDYDAPLTEWGEITDKYRAFREVIKNYSTGPLPDLPEPVVLKSYGSLSVSEQTSLFDNLQNLSLGVKSPYTLSMEEVDQSTGYIVYQHDLGKKRHIDDFRLVGANDRATVYVNRKHLFTQYDKEIGEKETFELQEDSNQLSILVENMGRVNYGPRMPHQRKGIVDGVYVNGAFRSEWIHYPLPLDSIKDVDYSRPYEEGEPGFHKFSFTIDEIHDTFVDMSGWGKGCVFINGFNLGRFWDKGPQYKLYLPAPLLKEGSNVLVVFETEGKVKTDVSLTNEPPYSFNNERI